MSHALGVCWPAVCVSCAHVHKRGGCAGVRRFCASCSQQVLARAHSGTTKEASFFFCVLFSDLRAWMMVRMDTAVLSLFTSLPHGGVRTCSGKRGREPGTGTGTEVSGPLDGGQVPEAARAHQASGGGGGWGRLVRAIRPVYSWSRIRVGMDCDFAGACVRGEDL